MIPSGFYLTRGKDAVWPGLGPGYSDTGVYAHIINAAAAYKEYLDSKTDWDLFGTVMIGPTPTASITSTPTVSPTPLPGSTTFSFTVFLHGIGNSGDSVNETAHSLSNKSPQTVVRNLGVSVFNSLGSLVLQKSGSITYQNSTGNFTGVVDMGTTLMSGAYRIEATTDKYLRKNLVEGSITAAVVNTFSPVSLVSGDVNLDKSLDILDYNIILDCYSDLAPAKNCADATKKFNSDLSDDGSVNQFDYNLFLREYSHMLLNPSEN